MLQEICFYCSDESVEKQITLSLFVVSLCSSDLGGGGCLLMAGSLVGGPQRAGYMASLSEGRAVGVGLGERLVTVAVAATAGEPQSVTGGGLDEGRMHLKSAPINGGHTGALASSEPSRSADGGLRRRSPSSTSLFVSTEEFVVFRA